MLDCEGGRGSTECTLIRATSLRIVGLVLLALGAALGGGIAGAWLVAGGESVPAPVVTPVQPTPDAGEALRLAIPRALESVVTIAVDPTGEAPPERGGLNYGSGVVISADGLVLTARHVIAGAASISIVLPGGEERTATVLADDYPFQDVALLRVDGRGLRPARLGASATVRPGDPVAVISTGVYTYDNQVKQGIISGSNLHFPRPGVTYLGMLQTDAAVNNGDSGAPLFNAAGEVVGLVTSVVRQNPAGDAVQGVGYAHAIDDLKPFIEAVAATGVNPRPRIGVERLHEQHVALDAAMAASLGVPVTAGAAIIKVASGSPAEEAGIQPGDVIVAVGGIAVDSTLPFVNLLAAAPTGSQLRLTVLRGTEAFEVLVDPRPVTAAGAGTGG